jgi:hypothetical protein
MSGIAHCPDEPDEPRWISALYLRMVCPPFLTMVYLFFNSVDARERYLTAAIYISSRAFPSSILSSQPTLVVTPSTEPILLPGVDSLNHKRAQPVSWLLSSPNGDASISLISHMATGPGEEIFNNYGPKPNSELILAYGFTLSNNPDDTIILKIGGGSRQGQKWEIGRNANGMDDLWKELLSLVAEPATEDAEDENSSLCYEDFLEASAMLSDMTQTLLDRLPGINDDEAKANMREDVYLMRQHYLEGLCDYPSTE